MEELRGIKLEELPRLSRWIVATFLRTQHLPYPKKLPAFLQRRQACFVSLHYRKNNELRGCIGTIEPVRNNLWEELCHNALSAAFSDPRFPPLTEEELDKIKFSVDLLSPLQKATLSELDPKKLGLVVRAPDGRRGVLLPNIEGIKTAKQQLSICLQKAGIHPKEKYSLYVFQTQRFEE